MNKNKIILVGISPIVGFHIKALRKVGLEPIAVAPLNYYQLSEKKFVIENSIKKTYTDWKEMISTEDCDGIVIASRTESTIDVLEYAVQKNVPILVEKPVSFQSQEIKNIIKKSHDKILVGYNRRFYKTVSTVRDYVMSERTPVIATMNVPESPIIRSFFKNSTHSFDMLRYIFGEIHLEFVKKLISNDVLKGFVATFSNERNDLIQVIGNWGSSENFSLSVNREKRRFELKPYEELIIYEGIDVIEPSSTNLIRKYIPKPIEKINLESVDSYFKPGFYHQSKAFAELIKNGSKSDIAATLFDAQRAIEICEEIIGKYKDNTAID